MSAWTARRRSMLAAAYVLGTLRGPARAAMHQRLARDAELRAAVYRWERHFSVLLRGFKPVLPTEGRWKRIEAAATRAATDPRPSVALHDDATAMTTPPPLIATRPGSHPGSRRAAPTAAARPEDSKGRRQAPALGPKHAAPAPPVVDEPTLTAPEVPRHGPRLDGPIAPRATRPGAGRRGSSHATARRAARPPRGPLPLLKVWAVAATVLAMVFGGLLSVSLMDEATPIPEPQGLLIAALAADGGRWVVQSTANGEQILVQVEGAPKIPANRSAELWWIGADGTPVSVGVLPDTGRQGLTRQGLTGDEPAPTFAVSIEPRGGSPTGAPTGKVITTFTAVRSL